MPFSFCAGHSTVGEHDDEPGLSLKVSGDACELNVHLALTELHLLDRVTSTPWEGGALNLGRSANADVWWSCDDGHVFIAVGADDQTWDFGVHISLADFSQLRAAIDAELATSPP